LLTRCDREQKLTALATGDDHADKDDPEIMADVLRLVAFSVLDDDQQWARALQQGRCPKLYEVIGRAALRCEHAPLVAAAGMLVNALNVRHDNYLERELTGCVTSFGPPPSVVGSQYDRRVSWSGFLL
jgi:hypothetical protein